MIYIAIVVVGLILLWNFLTPSGGGKSMVGMEPLTKANADAEVNRRNEARLAREAATLEPKITDMAFNVPPDQLVPQTVRDLQQIAAKSGVHIREIKPIRPRTLTSGMGSSVPVEVHFQAPFQPNAMKFLYYVEDPAGKMVLDKLDITSADPRRKTVEVSAQITVYTKISAGAVTSDTGDKSSATSIN